LSIPPTRAGLAGGDACRRVYDDFEELEGEPPPTEDTRFVKVVPRDEEELRALEAFTTPCTLCIPGARELWAKCPVDFES
jgi:hypothetical protein